MLASRDLYCQWHTELGAHSPAACYNSRPMHSRAALCQVQPAALQNTRSRQHVARPGRMRKLRHNRRCYLLGWRHACLALQTVVGGGQVRKDVCQGTLQQTAAVQTSVSASGRKVRVGSEPGACCNPGGCLLPCTHAGMLLSCKHCLYLGAGGLASTPPRLCE